MALPHTLSGGFNLDEAVSLLSIAQQTYINTPDITPNKNCVPCPVDIPPPDGWQLRTDKTPSSSTVLNNYWQVWQNTANPKQYAIAIRGTVDTVPSVLADLLLPMVEARLPLPGLPIHFNLARDEGDSPIRAAVHAGFSLSLMLMLLSTDAPLALTLFELARSKSAEVYITGHSQGASIALLLSSLMQHTPLFHGSRYKSYVFAPAKPGNDHYAYDLDQSLGIKGLCYSVISTQDWVPEVPLTLQGLASLNRPNALYHFSGNDNPALTPATQDLLDTVSNCDGKALDKLIGQLHSKTNQLRSQLAHAHFPLSGSQLGLNGSATTLGVTLVEKIIDDLLDNIVPSLNYCKAGSLAPLFAPPGANPQDGHCPTNPKQFDFFWQHHLCNYLKVLREEYGEM